MHLTRSVATALALLVATGCGDGCPEHVDVRVELGDGVDADVLRIMARPFGATDYTFDRRYRLADELELPAFFRVEPADSTPGRRFEVILTLEDASGGPIQSQRRIGAFTTCAARHVTVRFEESCGATSCGEGETCRSEACVDACVEPTVEPSETPTPLVACELTDAGSGDAGPGLDAQAPGDGGTDSGLDDAGAPSCGPPIYFEQASGAANVTTSVTLPPIPAGTDCDWLMIATASLEMGPGPSNAAGTLVLYADGSLLSWAQASVSDASRMGPVSLVDLVEGSPDARAFEAQFGPCPTAALSDLPCGAVSGAMVTMRDLHVALLPVASSAFELELDREENDLSGTYMEAGVVSQTEVGGDIVLLSGNWRPNRTLPMFLRAQFDGSDFAPVDGMRMFPLGNPHRIWRSFLMPRPGLPGGGMAPTVTEFQAATQATQTTPGVTKDLRYIQLPAGSVPLMAVTREIAADARVPPGYATYGQLGVRFSGVPDASEVLVEPTIERLFALQSFVLGPSSGQTVQARFSDTGGGSPVEVVHVSVLDEALSYATIREIPLPASPMDFQIENQRLLGAGALDTKESTIVLFGY